VSSKAITITNHISSYYRVYFAIGKAQSITFSISDSTSQTLENRSKCIQNRPKSWCKHRNSEFLFNPRPITEPFPISSTVFSPNHTDLSTSPSTASPSRMKPFSRELHLSPRSPYGLASSAAAEMVEPPAPSLATATSTCTPTRSQIRWTPTNSGSRSGTIALSQTSP